MTDPLRGQSSAPVMQGDDGLQQLDQAEEHGKRESRNGGSGGDGKELLGCPQKSCNCCEAPELTEEMLGVRGRGGRDATCAPAHTQRLINFRGLFALTPVAPRRASGGGRSSGGRAPQRVKRETGQVIGRTEIAGGVRSTPHLTPENPGNPSGKPGAGQQFGCLKAAPGSPKEKKPPPVLRPARESG